MIYPAPLFVFREWGTHVAPGQTCPDCLDGHLQEYLVCPRCLAQVFLSPGQSSNATCSCGHPLKTKGSESQTSMQCDNQECRSFYLATFHRNHHSAHTPARIGTLSTDNMPLFASVQHYIDARPTESTLHYADFVMDLDRSDFNTALSDLFRLVSPLEQHGVPHQVYYSGSKGFHVVIPAQVIGAKAANDLNHVQYRKFALHMTEMTGVELDPAIYSKARLLREPLTIHAKTGLYKVPLLPGQYEFARELAKTPPDKAHYLADTPVEHPIVHLWFTEAQQRELSFSASVATGHTDSRPVQAVGHELSVKPALAVPCVQNALENGPPMPGMRNKLNKTMAAYFISEGDDEAGMVDWARTTPGASSMDTHSRVAEARATYRWAKRTGYDFDCRDMKNLGLCDPKCHLHQFITLQTDLLGGHLSLTSRLL